MSDAAPKATITVNIDGVSIEANPGELVIAAAERHGVHIPRFCYHNRMNPVGMCRMCLVEVDAGRGPALQPSCMIPVSEGMSVDTTSERTRKAQDGVLEFLLINHPLDCPVCDKGGECPLQDNTFAFGPGESRFVEEKRHYEKPIAISENVFLDRERCILCDRCTRFAKEVAGDPLIHFIGRGSQTQVNTFPEEPFSSYFSGNVVQICPVGALTARPYRFRARPWDLDEVGSTCTGCSVGCAITVQASRDQVLRYQGVDSEAVNWGWLCDRGRFGFEAVNSEHRLAEPLLRGSKDAALETSRWGSALTRVVDAIRDAVRDFGPSSVAVLGGARLSNESQYAWAKLAKGVIGTDNVDAQLADGLDPSLVLGLPRATIAEACAAKGTIILLGPDPKEALGVLYLRLRHAVLEDGAQLIELGHVASGLSHLAAASVRCLPGGELLEAARSLLPGGERAHLLGDGPVTILLGRTSLSEDPAVIAGAVSLLAQGLPQARFLPLLARGNVFGALDAGLAPGLLPGRTTLEGARGLFSQQWGSVPSKTGLDARGILEAAALGRIKVLVLLGADPVADFPDRALAERALAGVGTVIALDQFLTASSQVADVVLPSAGFAEVVGTTTNLEGRVLPLNQKVNAPGTARADWMIAADLAEGLQRDLGFGSVEEIFAEMADVSGPLHGATFAAVQEAPEDGLLARGSRLGSTPIVWKPNGTYKIAPADPAALRLIAVATMYDDATLTQQSPSLGGLAPSAVVRLNPVDFANLGVEAGSKVKLATTTASIIAAARPDGAVPRGGAALASNLAGAEVNRLLDSANVVTNIRLEKI